MTPDQEKGQHGSCETVKVKSGDSFAVINKHDFKADEHELFEPVAEKPAKKGK